MGKYYSNSTWALYSFARFFLASIVFFSHLHMFFDENLLLNTFNLFGGKAAVIGFLLISGVSVGHSFIERPSGYFERRFMRIYPLYFFSVLFATLLMLLLPSPYKFMNTSIGAAGWKTAFANFFYGQNFFAITIPYNGPLWSLSVEVCFYILLPFLARLHTKIVILLIILSMSLFLFTKNLMILYGFVTAVFAWPWLIGFLISVKKERKISFYLSIIGLIIILFSELSPEPLSWLTYLLTLLIVFYGHNINVRLRVNKVFNFLGEISYPLYLFHMPLLYFLYLIAGAQTVWIFMIFTVIATIILNVIIDHWLKKIVLAPFIVIAKKIFHLFIHQVGIVKSIYISRAS